MPQCGVLCTNTIVLVFVDWKAISRMGKNNGFLLALKQWASCGGSGSPGEQSHSDRKAVGGLMTYSN